MNEIIKPTCQMTMDYTPKSWPTYAPCGKPAKYKDPKPRMGVEYVCGTHARSIDAFYKRIGENLKCIPIGKLL